MLFGVCRDDELIDAGRGEGADVRGDALRVASEDVSRIEAAMQIHYAEDDQRINAGKAAEQGIEIGDAVRFANVSNPDGQACP